MKHLWAIYSRQGYEGWIMAETEEEATQQGVEYYEIPAKDVVVICSDSPQGLLEMEARSNPDV